MLDFFILILILDYCGFKETLHHFLFQIFIFIVRAIKREQTHLQSFLRQIFS
jgi:hypothetical protein